MFIEKLIDHLKKTWARWVAWAAAAITGIETDVGAALSGVADVEQGFATAVAVFGAGVVSWIESNYHKKG